MSELRIAGQDGQRYCLGCGFGVHEPDSEDAWVGNGNMLFVRPFLCLCCGKEICGPQFAFGRMCGACDMGTCQPANSSYRETASHPKWEGVSAYMEDAVRRREQKIE
jgi:hypothetical protein